GGRRRSSGTGPQGGTGRGAGATRADSLTRDQRENRSPPRKCGEEKIMPDFRTLYDSAWIYAHDLAGKDVTVTIKSVTATKLRSLDKDKPEQKKPVLYFAESRENPPRGLILCKTNSRLIAAIYGNDTDAWLGKRITLFPARVEAFGQTVDAIRVRPTAPAKAAKVGKFSEAPTAPAPEAPTHAEVNEPAPPDYPEGSEA